MADYYGLFDPVIGRTATGEPLKTVTDVENWLAHRYIDDPVFKPVEGIEGRMVLVFQGRKRDDLSVLIALNGDEYDASRLVDYMTDRERHEKEFPNQVARQGTFAFLVEGRVKQHPALRQLVGETLCVLRMMTIITLKGEVEISHAVIKLQPELSGVSNLAQGAIIAGVDLADGCLGVGRRLRRNLVEKCSTIPGTDKSLEGFCVPHWPEVQSLVKEAAMVVPWCRCVGWDIAIGPDGPVLLEGNERWGPTSVQLGESRGILRGAIKDVYEFRKGVRRSSKWSW